MHFHYACTWDKGVSEPVNRDSFSLQTVLTGDGPYAMVAVADSEGYGQKGAYAGGYAVSSMTDWFYEHGLPGLCRHKSYTWLVRSFQRSLKDIHYQLQNNMQWKAGSNKTSFIILIVGPQKYYVFSVGKVFCFKFKNSRMSLISAPKRLKNNPVTELLGGISMPKVLCRSGSCRKKERFLICTDGFKRCMIGCNLQILQSKECIPEQRLRVALNEIVSRGRKKGEKDHCTGIILKRR